jgi:hypothetical protein
MMIDIRSLLEQDRQLVLETLELSRKLVLELEAAHYWTAHSIEVFGSVRNIGLNLARLLELTEEHWPEGKLVFNVPEGMKLWNTALGLWQALPPVRNRFVEQLSRRRRERIMGRAIEEPEELDPQQLQADSERYQARLDEVTALYERLGAAIGKVPAGLVPVLEGAPSANGQVVPPRPGAHVSEVAAPPATAAAAQSGVAPAPQAQLGQAQSQTADDEDALSPV